MSLSRRSFLNVVGPFGGAPFPAALMAARGREAALARPGSPPGDAAASGDPSEIRINSNENPLGPGPAAVEAFVNPLGPGPAAVEAFVRAFPDAGRYPTNARPSVADLRDTIARRLGVRPENVALGAGSWELLSTAVRLYTSSSRHLVTASPSFEQPEHTAAQLGVPVRRVPVDKDGRLDLDQMARAARWAGLVFFCNPNNPTGGVHSAKAVAEFVARVRRESPETAVLIDEAYHDYVTDPGYATSLALALEHPRTIEAFNRWAITFNQNSLTVAAAIASLGDPAHIEAERARNTEVRAFTTRFFQDLGYRVWPSETNFVFVEIGRPAKEFKEACARQKVLVGREFPPLEKTYARVSLGTLDEMKRANHVFTAVLGKAQK